MASIVVLKTALCRCGRPHDDWPAKNGGLLCQDCWEAECDEAWWEAARAAQLDRLECHGWYERNWWWFDVAFVCAMLLTLAAGATGLWRMLR